jgi:hypothetical protein
MLSTRVLSSLTSLELVWGMRFLLVDEAFTGMNDVTSSLPEPLLPSLRYLRISFTARSWAESERELNHVNLVTGLPFEDQSSYRLGRQLHAFTLRQFDELFDRIAPASAEITLSCPSWDWYCNIDLTLAETQGLPSTKTCMSEMEGLKCWRVIDREQATADAAQGQKDMEQGNGGRRLLDGYWIHVPVHQIQLYNDRKCTLCFVFIVTDMHADLLR